VGYKGGDALAGKADEGLVHQEPGIRISGKQLRQRRQFEGAAVGIVGIDDHRKRGSIRDLQVHQVKGETILREQRVSVQCLAISGKSDKRVVTLSMRNGRRVDQGSFTTSLSQNGT